VPIVKADGSHLMGTVRRSCALPRRLMRTPSSGGDMRVRNILLPATLRRLLPTSAWRRLAKDKAPDE